MMSFESCSGADCLSVFTSFSLSFCAPIQMTASDFLCLGCKWSYFHVNVSSLHHSSFSFSKEIECAHAILRREGAGVASSLGELMPVSVYPEQEHSVPVLTEEEGRCRRVFLTCGPTEDLFWAMHSIRYIIDAGVQKRYVCGNITIKLLTLVMMIVY